MIFVRRFKVVLELKCTSDERIAYMYESNRQIFNHTGFEDEKIWK